MAQLIPGVGVVGGKQAMLLPGAGPVKGSGSAATLVYLWLWSIYEILRKKHAN